MPSPHNSLPVYGPDNTLLYYAPIASVQRLIDSGRVSPRGTKHRVRALIALSGDLLQIEPAAHIPTGTRYSHRHETDDNPRGVWTLRGVLYGA